MVRQTMEGISGMTFAEISPATSTLPAVASTSQATWAEESPLRQASRTESAMVSQSLSGWPSVTDSAVKMYLSLMVDFPFLFYVLEIGRASCRERLYFFSVIVLLLM